jgi:UDP-glucose 4-epimerase
VREVPDERRLQRVTYLRQDVRDASVAGTLRAHAIDSVVHLASIVTPDPRMGRELAYAVDVLGTRNVLEPVSPPALPTSS